MRFSARFRAAMVWGVADWFQCFDWLFLRAWFCLGSDLLFFLYYLIYCILYFVYVCLWQIFFAPLSLPALRAVLLFFSGLWVCRASFRVLDCQCFIGCRVGRGLRVLGRLVGFFVDYSLIYSILYFLYILGSLGF